MADIDKLFRFSDANGDHASNNNSVQGFIEALEYAFYENAYTPLSMSHTCLINELRRVTIYDALDNNYLYESALDALAEQWSIPGWEFVGRYNVTTTVADRKNAVLKNTLSLMRVLGTPYAIERILETFGYTDVTVTEYITLSVTHDGTFDNDGVALHIGNFSNQLFNVELTSSHDVSQSDLDEQNAIISLINSYKKERVELYKLTINEPSNPGGRTIQVW